ncbi:hypothetical protein [Piscicoccus intestinalis]|uniref:hypothetical protein n=1 Tax=Piscicoccus intestinalis TaxID=746033 RepID=UPI0012EE404F|nr:hypothetical protein [Piscicoccus intestinalis]
MDGTQPAASWRVRWPVLDDSWTLARLRAAALPEFHRLAARAGVLAVPPIAWAVEEDDAGLWLVGEAAAETLAGIAARAAS